MKKILLLMALVVSTVFVFAQDSTEVVTASFAQDLLGMEGRVFGIALIWAVLGMFINIFSDVTRRTKPSEHSPVKFSMKYWLSDNWRRLVISFLLIPVAIVGVEQLFGVEMSRFVAFSIGYGSDHLIEIVKRKGVIKGATAVG